MATVVVSLDIGRIQDRMQEMRQWQDSKRMQPALFIYDAEVRGSVARIGFKKRDPAEAFAAAFAGNLI